jgi:hypothetical protein
MSRKTKKIVFVSLRLMTKIAGSRSPYPETNQNVTDSQHCMKQSLATYKKVNIEKHGSERQILVTFALLVRYHYCSK